MGKELIEVAEWRKQQELPRTRREQLKARRRRAWGAMIFGLTCALVWHFSHIAGEKYSPSLADVEFWLHLLVEGLIALYAAAFGFIVWGLRQGEK